MQLTNIKPSESAQLFSLPSTQQSVDSIETLLEKLNRQFSLSEQVFSSIWVALNEAIRNAIYHGNKKDPNKKVEICVELKHDNIIHFAVKDEGPGFDYEHVPDPTSPELIDKPEGRGIFLMKKLSDCMQYTNGGNTVDMYFDITKT